MDAGLAGMISALNVKLDAMPDMSKYKSFFASCSIPFNSTFQTVLNVTGKGYVDMITAILSGSGNTNKNIYLKITIDGITWLHFGINNSASTYDPSIGVLEFDKLINTTSGIVYPVLMNSSISGSAGAIPTNRITDGSLITIDGQVSRMIPISNKIFFNNSLVIEVRTTYNFGFMNAIANYTLVY